MVQLQNLTDREILILLFEKVERLEVQSVKDSEKFVALELRIAEIEIRYKMWAGVIGFVAGISASIITALLIKNI
jgi:hypothetical protein